MRRVSGLLAAVTLLWLVSLSAVAEPGTLGEAHQAGHWSGCVMQDGFDPYPVLLSPLGKDALKVTYPGLCSGVHVRHDGVTSDAVELIDPPASTCLRAVLINYQLSKGVLQISYVWDGEVRARARLTPGKTEKLCDPGKATS